MSQFKRPYFIIIVPYANGDESIHDQANGYLCGDPLCICAEDADTQPRLMQYFETHPGELSRIHRALARRKVTAQLDPVDTLQLDPMPIELQDTLRIEAQRATDNWTKRLQRWFRTGK